MDARKLIVVESNEKFGKAIQLYFRGSPYKPYVTGDADDAVQMAQRQSPELVVLCLENDRFDIADTVGKLKSDQATSAIPIILMSEKLSEKEISADSRLNGKFTKFLKKPFVKKAMLGAVDDVLAAGKDAAQDKSGAAKMPSSDGVDLNQIFSEIDDEIDEFFEKSEDPAKGKDTPAKPAPAAASSSSDDYVRVTDSGEYRSLQGKYQDKVNESNELRDKVRALEREIRSKSDEVKVLGSKGASVHLEKIKVLEKKIEGYEEERSKHTQKINQLSEMISSLNAELEVNNRKYKEEIDAATASNLELRSQIAELSDENDSKDRELKARDSEIQDLKKEIDELRSTIAEGESKRARLSEEIQLGQQKQQELEDQLRSEGDRASGLQSEISKLNASVDGLKAKILDARKSLETGLETLASE